MTIPFPYTLDPTSALHAVADRAHAVLLYGNVDDSQDRNVSILGVDPVGIVAVQQGEIVLENIKPEICTANPGKSPAHTLAQILDALAGQSDELSGAYRQGGILGYWGYDLCARFEGLAPHPGPAAMEPEAWWGVYPVLAVWDHRRREAHVAYSGVFDSKVIHKPDIEAQALTLHKRLTSAQCLCIDANRSFAGHELEELWSEAVSSLPYKQYAQAMETVLDHIRAGDIYQANLTQQFVWENHNRSAEETFSRLCACNPAAYSAFLDTGKSQILCVSPELFLRRKKDRLLTSPIKGTIRREQDYATETEQLLDSPKDAAEHIMIVDLERNDLGRICLPGSVQPSRLRYIQSLPHLHHLVSDVEGCLVPSMGFVDIFSAMLPGGSITGAPKIRAMEIIQEIEPVPRGVYTGAMGILEPGGNCVLNIAIRTAVKTGTRLSFGVGGGIVADSQTDAEYQECLLKGKSLLTACL